jgi:hypothetical protein
MNNHDFVVYRNDGKNDGPKVRFDDERYLRYVPIRRPWTMCMQERLPPGAAGALLNQTHMFNDLFLLIDPQEKQMFDAIDGRRSVSEIADHAEGASPRAREFFEKLWWFDQVVFDTSA